MTVIGGSGDTFGVSLLLTMVYYLDKSRSDRRTSEAGQQKGAGISELVHLSKEKIICVTG